jgi:cytidylate kinase
MEKYYSIAIDGPSGAGKSTVAKAVAERFSFLHLDTGAIYRTIAYALIKNGISCDDVRSIEKLLETIEISIEHNESGEQQMFLNGENVSDKIRTSEISMCASKSSALPVVREHLIKLQRDFADSSNVILDGRDIGTVVLPDADVKIFLDASGEIRAMRRYKELKLRYPDTDYEEVYRDLLKRDEQDMSREHAPLKAAADSITIDTSYLNLKESIEKVCFLIGERLGI